MRTIASSVYIDIIKGKLCFIIGAFATGLYLHKILSIGRLYMLRGNFSYFPLNHIVALCQYLHSNRKCDDDGRNKPEWGIVFIYRIGNGNRPVVGLGEFSN